MKMCMFLIFFQLFSLPALSQQKSKLSSKTKAKHKYKYGKKQQQAIKEKEEKLRVNPSDFAPKTGKFGANVSYSAGYDALEIEGKKTLTHSFSGSLTYSFKHNLSGFLSLGVSNVTSGKDVYRENDSDPFYRLSDLAMGLVCSFKLKDLDFIRANSLTLSYALPTSQESRIDQNYGKVSASYFFMTRAWNKFSLLNSMGFNYMFNKFKYSYADGDTLNRDMIVFNYTGLNYNIYKTWNARLGFFTRSTKFLNGSWNQDLGNNIVLTYNYRSTQFSLSYNNNAYPENENLDPVFYDRYRSRWSLGASYVF